MKLTKVLVALTAVILGLGVQSAFAQKYEVTPYAGGLWPMGHWRDIFEIKDQGIWGVRGGFFLSDRFELEGNVGFLNHFEFKNTDPVSNAVLWEVSPSFNFFGSSSSKFAPYVTLGAGGITSTKMESDLSFGNNTFYYVNQAPSLPIPGTPQLLTLDSGDTFFTFTYGGGLKGYGLWGPVGLRADFRGRSIPNFFGNMVSTFEATGGVTFTWGER